MSNDEVPRSQLRSSGWLLTALFVGLGLLWLMLLALVAAVAQSLADFELDQPVIAALFTGLFSGGMVAIAAALAKWRSLGFETAFAWRRCSGLIVLAALAGGALIQPLANELATFLAARFESLDPSHLEAMAGLLLEGPVTDRVMFAVLVILVAPLFEEMIFRGFLWQAIESSTSPRLAWLLTSLLFAGYHGDPLHIAALLPLSLVLGWLRLASNSLWPALAAHFGNNLCGVVTILLLGKAAS